MNIIVCTDGSDPSMAILPHAARLADAIGAEVVLTRVLDPRIDAASVVTPKLDDAVAIVQANWEDDLRNRLAREGVTGSVVVPHRVWSKEIADAINGAADGQGAALIALSSRGAGAMRHAFLGSVAMGVISKSALPVMTAGGAIEPPRAGGEYHLLVTSDGSPDSRSVFEGLAAVLIPGKVRVTLLEVATQRPGEDVEKDRRGYLNSLLLRLPAGIVSSVEVRMVPAETAAHAAICTAAQELQANAIAMATHGHSALRHLVAGSTALGVVANGSLPVILVKSRPVE